MYRFSVRSADPEKLPDARDRVEAHQLVLLAVGIARLALEILRTLLRAPKASVSALRIASASPDGIFRISSGAPHISGEAAVLARRICRTGRRSSPRPFRNKSGDGREDRELNCQGSLSVLPFTDRMSLTLLWRWTCAAKSPIADFALRLAATDVAK